MTRAEEAIVLCLPANLTTQVGTGAGQGQKIGGGSALTPAGNDHLLTHGRLIEKRFTQAELIELLQHLAKNVNLPRFQKHARGPKKPAKKRNTDKRTPHVSTAKILASRKK